MKTEIRKAIKKTRKYSVVSIGTIHKHDNPGHFVKSFANPEGHTTFIVQVTVKAHKVRRAKKRKNAGKKAENPGTGRAD